MKILGQLKPTSKGWIWIDENGLHIEPLTEEETNTIGTDTKDIGEVSGEE